jgi:hypothetical protein
MQKQGGLSPVSAGSGLQEVKYEYNLIIRGYKGSDAILQMAI